METVIKGLPSKVEFNKEDWNEHLIQSIEKENKIKSLEEELKKSKEDFQNKDNEMKYLLEAISNTFSMANPPPNGTKYAVYIEQNGVYPEDRNPKITFKPHTN